MKVNYTNLNTVGVMTLEEVIKHLERTEEVRKELNINNEELPEIELSVQVVGTTTKGLLLEEEGTYRYHFVYLKANDLKSYGMVI